MRAAATFQTRAGDELIDIAAFAPRRHYMRKFSAYDTPAAAFAQVITTQYKPRLLSAALILTMLDFA